MKKNYDPRVKMILVMMLTGFIIFSENLWIQGSIFFLIIVLAKLTGVNITDTIHKMKRFLILFFSIVVVQSLFVRGGESYLQIGPITLLSEKGLTLGIGYLFRVIVIIFSGAIISTSTMRNTMQGMVQLGLPYELALMTSIGVRFLPILMEEVTNAYTSMELRGINVNELPIKRRLEMIGRLFVPIVYSALFRARNLSESIEMRGFVIGEKRSSYFRLKLKNHDIILGISFILLIAGIFILKGRLL